MRRYWKYFHTLRWELWLLFFLSFVTIGFIDFWLINIPEYFPGGAKIGTLVSGLAFAFISAFVFYFIVVHVKEVRDKENVQNYIHDKVRAILNTGKNLFRGMAKEAEFEMNGEIPSNEELKAICDKINPNGNSSIVLMKNRQPLNWFEAIIYHFELSNDSLKKIYQIMPFLDTELVKYLASLEDQTHTRFFEGILELGPKQYNTLSMSEPILQKYLKSISELGNYYQRKLQ